MLSYFRSTCCALVLRQLYSVYCSCGSLDVTWFMLFVFLVFSSVLLFDGVFFVFFGCGISFDVELVLFPLSFREGFFHHLRFIVSSGVFPYAY